MARKSYDQRLKERWLRQEQESKMHVQREMARFERMMFGLQQTKKVIKSLFTHE